MRTRREFLQCAAAAPLLAAASSSAPAARTIDHAHGPRMKLSLAAYSLRSKLPRNAGEEEFSQAEMTLADFIDFCAELDLDGTELTSYYFPRFVQETPIEPHAEEDEETSPELRERIDTAVSHINSLKNQAFRLGLDISGTAIGNNFCVPEGPEWETEIRQCREWIDRAAVLGAPVIRIFAGRVPKNDTAGNAIKRCAAAIDECLKHAAKRGVFLALENHGGITSDPGQMLEIVESVGPSDWFGINFDSGNFHGDDPYADLERIAPYAVNAQIKVSVAPGGQKQPADFERIVGILKAADYRGYLVLEYEESGDPLVEIPKQIERLRSLVES